MARKLAPRTASTHVALGFAHHLQGHINTAIDHYHKALGLKPDDTFASEMLSRALQAALDSDFAVDIPSVNPLLDAANPAAAAAGGGAGQAGAGAASGAVDEGDGESDLDMSMMNDSSLMDDSSMMDDSDMVMDEG